MRAVDSEISDVIYWHGSVISPLCVYSSTYQAHPGNGQNRPEWPGDHVSEINFLLLFKNEFGITSGGLKLEVAIVSRRP